MADAGPALNARTAPGQATLGWAAAPDVAQAATDWLRRLGDERRYSKHTLDNYGRDLGTFLRFLSEHLGAPPDMAALAALKQADVRAWSAARRRDDLAPASIARGLSAVRGFFRDDGHITGAQNSQARHWNVNFLFDDKSSGPELRRLEEVEALDELFEWNPKGAPDSQCKWNKDFEMVGGPIIGCSSEHERPHWRWLDDGTWNSHAQFDEAEVEHPEFHRV